jgi:hypothetical protein
MSPHREHYQPRPVRRAHAALDFIGALIFAALIGAPFAFYFWGMTP